MDSRPSPPFRPAKYLVCVSDTAEARVALKLACLKARGSAGLVEMLHVIPPADFQTLSSVADIIREEQRGEAEGFMSRIAEEANAVCGILPRMLIREGQIGEGILAALESDAEIDMLVLGAAENAKGKGTLIAWLAQQLGGKLQVPLLLVPGNLTDQQLLALV